jgi:hypothetical protein
MKTKRKHSDSQIHGIQMNKDKQKLYQKVKDKQTKVDRNITQQYLS